MSRDGSSDESPEEEDGGDTGESLCQGEDNFKDIAVYFSKKQWVQLREWEKVRFKNVKQNYETMIKIGLRIPPPTFMSHGRQNKTAKVEESGDSDEEWTPQQLMKNLRFPSKGKQKTHLRNKEMAKEPVKPKAEGMMDLSEELKMVVMNKLTISKVMKQMDQMDEICTTNQLTEEKMVADPIPECRRKEVEVHMYNLRERKYKMYQETWDPQDDDYLFCEECQTFFLETCAVHGPPKFAHDSAMIKGHPYCSAITLPPGLRIGLSGIPGAGLGVWNEASNLPLGLHFGPYEGQTTEDDEAANSGYSWMVTKGRNSYEYVDGKEESCSNWMRYVNCARNEEEQNLVAFQYHRQIFYRTCRVIRPGCELLVWYGDEYGQELGIKWGSKWKRPLTALTGESPGIHLCPACPLDFSTPAVLNQHMLLHHPSQGTRNNYGMGERQPDQQLPLPGDSCGSDKAETSQKGSLLGKTKQVDLEELPSLSQSQQVRVKESYSGEWDFSGIQGKSTKHTTQTFQEGDKKWFGTYKYGKYLQGFSSKSVITHRQTHSREKPHMCEECGRRFTEKSGLTRHRQTHSGEKPHVCEECGRGFTSKSALITHGQTHTREKPYICEVCEGGFTNKSALIAHGRTHSREKPYVCEVCEEGFTNKSVLIAHRRIHAREKPYVCGVCGQRFKSKSALIGHSRTHSEGKPFVCEVCGQRFTYKSYLIVHSQTHLGEKPYTCKECEQGFTNKPALIAHSRIHSGEKPYVCEECGGGFTYKSYLIIHRRTHSGEKPHVCEECGRGFIQRSDLKRHWWTHSGKKPYACEECGRGYTRQSVLNKHRWTHSKEKPFTCEECKQEFTQKSALIIHRQTHLEGKPYACDKYGQGFTYQSALIAHKWTHSGEKPHVCEECGRGFTYKSVLITHRRGHSGEKPYTCEECGRGFTYKSYLTVHKQIHLGEKPHVCEECGQGFIQRSDLKRHRCIHSGEKPYVCEECGRGFARKSILKRHRWTHSREKPSSCEECKQGLTELRPQEPQVNTVQERSFMFVRNVSEDLCTRQPLSHTGGHAQERSFIIVRRVGEDLYTSQSFSYIGRHT